MNADLTATERATMIAIAASTYALLEGAAERIADLLRAANAAEITEA
jgi:hypothetical protein